MSASAQIMKYFVAVASMVPMLLAALVVGVVHRRAGWRIVRSWNRLFARIFGLRVRVEKECSEEDLSRGGVIVGLTQQSLLDPTLAFAAIDRHWLAIWNIEYALIPVFGWVSFILGWVIVRQSLAHSRRQLAKASAYASAGGLIYLSAEGRRSQDGQLNPYKKGPAVLAIESQAQILPLYSHGSRNCLPYGEWKIRPGEVVLRFLQPVPVRGLTYADRNELLALLQRMGEQEHAKHQGPKSDPS